MAGVYPAIEIYACNLEMDVANFEESSFVHGALVAGALLYLGYVENLWSIQKVDADLIWCRVCVLCRPRGSYVCATSGHWQHPVERCQWW